jgi:hypothetical protein
VREGCEEVQGDDGLETRAACSGESAAAGLHGAVPESSVGRRHHLHLDR